MCKSTKKVSNDIVKPGGFSLPTLFNLTDLNQKKIKVNFNVEQVSNDGGLLLLKVAESLNLPNVVSLFFNILN